MKMKLKQWASFAEIIGALAIVISLVYVGVQVNDSAGAVRSASANDANVALQAFYLQIGADRETSSTFYRGLTSEQALTNDEEYQFLMLTHGAFLGFQNIYLLAEEGTIDEELLNTIKTTIDSIHRLPGLKRYWRQRRSYLHAGFADWVDRVSVQGAETTMDLYKTTDGEPTEKTPD
jgi:hypothetical protein